MRKSHLSFIALLILSCNSPKEPILIKRADCVLEGDIKIDGGDTILNGSIKSFSINNGKLLSSVEYKNNKKEGEAIEYYSNTKIYSVSRFINDLQHGNTIVYDSLGAKMQESNFYHGIAVGPIVDYINNKPSKFRFITFDGVGIYKCEYNSKSEILEQGSLLNYTINYFNEDRELRLSVFLYLISPPHKQITYRLFDKDLKTGDSLLVFKWSYDSIPFKKFTLDIPQSGHSYLWDVEAFYPSENVRIGNILPAKDRMVTVEKEN